INVLLNAGSRKFLSSIPSKRVLRYPKKSPTGSARTFAQLFKVLDLAHEATDIYYRDVSLFGKQRVVDSLVDDLAATFELDRSDLNIRSSSKGVVCGSGLTITLLSGEMIQCKDAEGTLIPAGEDVESFSIDDDVAWVLVIEKEAVFQTLCRLQMCKNRSLPGSGIIITGKGYPDVATRHLVKSLADALPRRIPIMGLVDSDPYGLDILSVYKYGSQKLQHENDKLAAGRIRWLGIWASELESLNIGKDFLLPITTHDEKKALSILRRQNFPLPRKWKKELQYMLHSRRKAEIEIVTGGHDISRPTNDGDIIQERNVNKKDQGGDNPEPFLLQKTCNAHGLFIQYLTTKITNYVISASESRTEY
ncbi:DNA topoisomerase IV, alpha subunit, partial [Pholiota conissans]